MGNVSSLFYGKKSKIVLIGLDGAGKSSLLYSCKFKEKTDTCIPTIGFNHETFEMNDLMLDVWDLGGDNRIRNQWHNFFDNVDGIVFVVDSSNVARANEARRELHQTLRCYAQLEKVPVLVFANKQDLPNALAPFEVESRLDVHDLPQDFVRVEGLTAHEPETAMEGLTWLANRMKSTTSFKMPFAPSGRCDAQANTPKRRIRHHERESSMWGDVGFMAAGAALHIGAEVAVEGAVNLVAAGVGALFS